jgi:hypothetical protein
MPNPSKAKYRTEIELTSRRLQPFSVWFRDRIIGFEKYRENAEARLKEAFRQVQQA